jgi:hypothetical protein
MAGAHVQIYLWTFDRGWPQKYIIQKCMSGIYDVNVEGNSLVMCSCAIVKRFATIFPFGRHSDSTICHYY